MMGTNRCTSTSQAILMAKQMRLSNACGINWWKRSRAMLEANGCRHWATTHSILPRWPQWWQSTNQWWKNTPSLLAVSMAIAMRWYNTTHIAQWRRSRASLEATGCHHWPSICSNNIKGTYPCQKNWCFLSSTRWKRPQGKQMAPTNNAGVAYQTDEKHLSKTTAHFVGVVKVA